jgi:hypothetical protein
VAKCLGIQTQIDGDHAAYFRARIATSNYSAACYIYTVEDTTGWHFLDMTCAVPEGDVFGPDVGSFDSVRVPAGSCANVRDAPGLGGKVLTCISAGTTVKVDGGPDYVVEVPPNVSHLWWHIQDKGWMAHDFLVGVYTPP